jgi:short-chain Z-isoprenyl diphosphate synthase
VSISALVGEEGRLMGFRDLAYRLYERRLEASLTDKAIPRHVGVMCDGNRRWAKSAGHSDVSKGHRKGADKIFELIEWCKQTGVEVVTLWLLSTDNLSRPKEELEKLLPIIEDTVTGLVDEGCNVKPMGALDLLPDQTARVLKHAAEATCDNPGLIVNVAVGYGGRREIADAVRSLLQEHDRGTRGERRRRAHRGAPVHGGPAGSRPGDPDERRAATRGFPAVAIDAF